MCIGNLFTVKEERQTLYSEVSFINYNISDVKRLNGGNIMVIDF